MDLPVSTAPFGRIPPADQMDRLEPPDDESVKLDHIAIWVQRLRKEVNSPAETVLNIDERTVYRLERELSWASEDLAVWKRGGILPERDRAKLVKQCEKLVNYLLDTLKDLQGSAFGQIAPIGLLERKALGTIKQHMIDDALGIYMADYRKPPHVTALLVSSLKYTIDPCDAKLANRAFCGPYFGRAAERLNETLENLYTHDPECPSRHEPPVLYAPVVPILQSAGSGKTRTVIELARKQIGLYICIREPSPLKHSIPLPAQDWSAYKSLSPHGRWEWKAGVRICITSWLWSFAINFTDFLKSQQREGQEYSSYVEDVAATLMNDIVPGFRMGGTAGSRRSPPAASNLSIRDVLLHKIFQAADKKEEELKWGFSEYRSYDQSFPEYVDWARLKDAFRGLQDLIPSGRYCFLAIDDAASMGDFRLIQLRWILNKLDLSKFRLLVVGTSDKIVEYTNREIDHNGFVPSTLCCPKGGSLTYRYMERPTGIRILPSPFTLLFYDASLWENKTQVRRYIAILSGTYPARFEEVVAFLPLMGRPLMNGARVYGGKFGLTYQFAAMLYEKLVGTANLSKDSKAGGSSDIGRVIAAASQRMPLDIVDQKSRTSSNC